MEATKQKKVISAKTIAHIATMIATLVGGKLALAVLPNIEIVTLLLIVYALSFGLAKTMIATVAFILIEILIWGANPMWIVLYFIHWPLLVLAVSVIRLVFLKKRKERYKPAIILAVIIGIVATVIFGVLSSFIEMAFVISVRNPDFWLFFAGRYIAGLWFFVTHIIANTVILSLFVLPLTILLRRIKA